MIHRGAYGRLAGTFPPQDEQDAIRFRVLGACRSKAQRDVANALLDFKFTHHGYCSLEAEKDALGETRRVDFRLTFRYLPAPEYQPIVLYIEVDDTSHLNGSRYMDDLRRERELAIRSDYDAKLRYYWKEVLGNPHRGNPEMVVEDVKKLLKKLIGIRIDIICNTYSYNRDMMESTREHISQAGQDVLGMLSEDENVPITTAELGKL